ncbi:MAG: methionyl-tRNA formyltransferase [Rhizobiaceae bacterium]|nr:methionyl-tRNA formyltransferase [Rhizobiaceae bacterium]
MPLRLIFMGTPVFSVAALDALNAAGHDICAVYTQPPRAGGRRGLDLTPSPVHRRAEELGLDVRTPARLRDPADQQALAALNADAAVVVAYGLLLPKAVLDAPRLGCFNIHASLLPRWRGAAPIHRAIMAGDTETGVMVMRMEEGLDTGPVAMAKRLAIGADETTGELHDRLAAAGAALIVEAMARLEQGDLPLTPQPDTGVTYASKIDKAEARIDWSLPAADVHNRIRGLSPFPGAWCEMDLGAGPERVKLLGATLDNAVAGPLGIMCGAGGRVTVTRLQRAGGKAVDAATFLNGATVRAIR